jgi:hypothetical protein
MIKKTITYTDYSGNKREEDFYFNINKAEAMEMEFMEAGGMVNMIRRIIKENDPAKLVTIFKNIILKSYGEKSPDGKRFIKSQELIDAFTQTEAYSQLFMELSTDADKASEFINGILSSLSDLKVIDNKDSVAQN